MSIKTAVFVLIILVSYELDDDVADAQPEPQSYIPPPPPLKIPEAYQLPNGPDEVPPFCAKGDAETDPAIKKCCKAILVHSFLFFIIYFGQFSFRNSLLHHQSHSPQNAKPLLLDFWWTNLLNFNNF